jgi:hypothetical protein
MLRGVGIAAACAAEEDPLALDVEGRGLVGDCHLHAADGVDRRRHGWANGLRVVL